jgi:O-antigen ligase
VTAEKIKALIFVLALATPAFYITERIAGPLIPRREFVMWRRIWFAVTIAAFLLSYYFVFAAILIAICIYAHGVRVASVGLYFLLLLAAPMVSVTIGGFAGITTLLDLNNSRVLSAVLLLPFLFKQSGFSRGLRGASAVPDRLIICYVLLLTVIEFRRSDVTGVARTAISLTLDVLIPYFVFSRAVTGMVEFRRVFLAFVVAVVPLSLISVFEIAKGWRLYGAIFQEWGSGAGAGYSSRNGLLRAGATAQGPIAFGFVSMVAIGCTLAMPQTIQSRRYARFALAILIGGLAATLSKGPWIGAAVLVLVYGATGSGAAANLSKLGVIGAAAVVGLLLTPVGQQLIEFLPGSAGDAGSVEYRQRLITASIRLIQHNPLFGSADVAGAPEMQQMMTGQQIIDIVNSYLSVALNYGLVGFGLFLGFFAAVLVGLWQVLKLRSVQGVPFGAYARASMATLIAILLTIGTVSSVDFIAYIYWSFAGLCVALIRIGQKERVTVMRAVFANRIAA